MKTLFIPPLGTEVVLAAPWKFTVHNEGRNESLIEWMGKLAKPHDGRYSSGHPLGEVTKSDGGRDWEASESLSVKCTLPKGTKLKLDRIYIRKGVSDFDSVTFFLIGAKTQKASGIKKGVHRQLKVTSITNPFGPLSTKPENYESVPYEYAWTKPARPVRFWAKLAEVNGMKIK